MASALNERHHTYSYTKKLINVELRIRSMKQSERDGEELETLVVSGKWYHVKRVKQ